MTHSLLLSIVPALAMLTCWFSPSQLPEVLDSCCAGLSSLESALGAADATAADVEFLQPPALPARGAALLGCSTNAALANLNAPKHWSWLTAGPSSPLLDNLGSKSFLACGEGEKDWTPIQKGCSNCQRPLQ